MWATVSSFVSESCSRRGHPPKEIGLEPSGMDVVADEVVVGNDLAQQRQVRPDTADLELGECLASTLYGVVAIVARDDQLGDHAVVEGGYRGAGFDEGVQPDARARRRLPLVYAPRRRSEPVSGVLGVDPELDGMFRRRRERERADRL